MKITPIKTKRVEAFSIGLTDFLASALKEVPEKSVVAITSKVVSLCEGNVLSPLEFDRDDIIEREADRYLEKSGTYDVYLTIKGNVLTPNSGVDESNAGGYLVLWPQDPQASAERIWRYIRERYGVKEVGVIITDSTATPLKWGVSGVCIAHCGFEAVNDKVGQKDLFGRELRMTRVNVADSLAAACVLCMGEADECTPLSIAQELPFVRFADREPSQEELKAMKIGLEEDLFGQLLCAVRWKKRDND